MNTSTTAQFGCQSSPETGPLTGAALARWCYNNPNLAASTIEGLRGHAQWPKEPTLAQVVQAFETIRLKLIHCLEEPERSAFWLAVQMRDALADTSTDRPAADPFNRKQVEAVCRAVCAVKGVDPDGDVYGDNCDAQWTRYADAVAEALSFTSPDQPAPFYGAQCPSYPNCTGGCGLGCTHEIEQARLAAHTRPDRGGDNG